MSFVPAVLLLNPALPLWFIGLALAGAVAGIWATYSAYPDISPRVRGVMGGLRVAALLILAWLVLQPERRTKTEKNERPVLAVVVDTSASMEDSVPGAERYRSERVREFFGRAPVRRAMADYNIEVYEVASELRRREAELRGFAFDGPRSYLSQGMARLAQRCRQGGVAGVLLLSDGLDQKREDSVAERLPVPVIVPELELPPSESAAVGFDYRVAELNYARMTVVGWRTPVKVLVRRRGAAAEASIPLTLYQDGEPIRSAVAQFERGAALCTVSVVLEPSRVGARSCRVELTTPDGDLYAVNDARDFRIDVTDPENRILYLEGTARWDFKFLKRALLGEKNLHTTAYVNAGGGFIRFGDAGQNGSAGLPELTAEELRRYRVVILGDLGAEAVPPEAWEALAQFVENGGGLLLLGARRAYGPGGITQVQPLAQLLPAMPDSRGAMREGRLQVSLTENGQAHPAFRNLATDLTFPPILTLWQPATHSEFATVLVRTAGGAPVVVSRKYGQGRVLMVLTDSLWRWRMGTSTRLGAKDLYDAVVTQLVYWLIPGHEQPGETDILQILLAEADVSLREPVSIGIVGDASADDTALPQCEIRLPDGRGSPLRVAAARLGREVGLAREMPGHQAGFLPVMQGRHEIRVTSADGTQTATASFFATRPEHEYTGAPLNREFLVAMAEQTGGAFVPFSEWDRALDSLHAENRSTVVVSEHPLGQSPWWLAALISLFSLEWWLRRRMDLV